VRVYRDGFRREEDDGYRSELVPGLRASADALRLAEEIDFAGERLEALAESPPGLYGKAREEGLGGDLEQAAWTCLLITYLCPLQDPQDPFAGIRLVLEREGGDWSSEQVPELQGVPLGPLSSHESERGPATLLAYRQWVRRHGSQEQAYAGDPLWTPERRFERIFERLTIPGLGRHGRFELLVVMGRLGLFDLRADSLHLGLVPAAARPTAGSSGAGAREQQDLSLMAAKRVFGIGDTANLERRANALARAAEVPIEALELALANWSLPERATLGFPADAIPPTPGDALERAGAALGL